MTLLFVAEVESTHAHRHPLAAGDVETVAAFRDRAPGMLHAHPTIEHFAPMFVTLGASGDAEAAPDQAIDGFWMGLSKRPFVVHRGRGRSPPPDQPDTTCRAP